MSLLPCGRDGDPATQNASHDPPSQHTDDFEDTRINNCESSHRPDRRGQSRARLSRTGCHPTESWCRSPVPNTVPPGVGAYQSAPRRWIAYSTTRTFDLGSGHCLPCNEKIARSAIRRRAFISVNVCSTLPIMAPGAP